MRSREATRVGVTGACGRIGRVLARHWTSHSHNRDVTLFVRDEEQKAALDADIIASAAQLPPTTTTTTTCRVVDLVTCTNLEEVFSGLDVVIHLAALVDCSTDASNVRLWNGILHNNIAATYNVLNACVKAKVKRVILASSNHVQHGITIGDPKDPRTLGPNKLGGRRMHIGDDPWPDSLYGASKLFAEDLGKVYALRYGLEVVALRIGWVRIRDDPSDLRGTPSEPFMRAIYLSYKDCIGFFNAAIDTPLKGKTPKGIPFMCAYACSNNTLRVWDLSQSILRLGYSPTDNAELFFLPSAKL
ncbi:NAD dependent epimerase/dehydratase superfamily protein [Pelomyxa schiedti]|nr:NAD dependent epimerase/dehydratase superfamily protein [Pelomyxa schiedti]